jgi:hypothetical protein
MATVRLVSFYRDGSRLRRDMMRFGCRLAVSAGMPGEVKRMGWRDRFAIAALLLLPLLASGCGGNLFGGPAATAPASASSATVQPATGGSGSSSSSYLSGFFAGSSDKGPQAVAGATPDVECPYIDIREGASTLTVSAGSDNSAMSVKYQGIFVRAARQCAVVAGQMVMKVGVEGRIILGPAGGPGALDVPLRIAVVDESPAGTKPIVTKLVHIPVTVQSSTDNPSFAHVEDGLTFPLPPSSIALARYIVYIGFDPLAAEAEKKPKPKPKHNPVRKPAPGTG